MNRNWQAARAKVDAEGCRLSGATQGVEAAHIIGRSQDFFTLGCDRYKLHAKTLTVEPLRIVPLRADLHRAYDRGEIDLLPNLTLEEQVQAVRDAGGIEAARRRLIGSGAWRRDAGVPRRAA